MLYNNLPGIDPCAISALVLPAIKTEEHHQAMAKQPSLPPMGPISCVGPSLSGPEAAQPQAQPQTHSSGTAPVPAPKRAPASRRWDHGMGDDIVTLFPRRKAGQTRPGGGRGPVVLTLELLQQFYGMPLHVAAKQLGICQTAIKKVCRKLGIKKWPYKEMRLPGTKDDSTPSSPTSDDVESSCGSDSLGAGNDVPVDFASTSLRKGNKSGKGKNNNLSGLAPKSDEDMDFAVHALLSLQSKQLVAAF
mmetsp:Transcript_15659/g.24329  ORF Transcript_15659/g.24329 Transcript_15659/m.24329 type:complete len:247 (+) Transcript_15659:214-954(+)|eukprot:CAMPEP_0184317136 /NCGR_PEP_ID=MMETSP1049-20130417/94750_1 /TAXON_ID=77928 /ORGANISM="Proteomonas sulcata, Strain CCMP704" /LENGTH=246 /DNA_ID=CAMNT_0026636405 /DNA_START=71 /DNA_END=811 /DNA_ORIENTATION=-